MKLITLLLFVLTISFVNSYNYYDPLGLDPEPKKQEEVLEDDSLDIVPNMPTNIVESKSTESEILKKYTSRFATQKVVRPGYLDVNVVYKGVKDLGKHVRFMQKSLTFQDDDFFNRPNVNDQNNPPKDVMILNNAYISNGVVKFDNKRVLNVETGKFPDFKKDLRKD